MYGALARRVGTNQSIGRFLIAALAFGFLLLLAAGLAAVQVTRDTQRHAGWVAHTLEVEIAIAQAQILVEQAEATRRGYLLAGQQRYYDAYLGFEAGVMPAVERVQQLSRDNPRQLQELVTYRNAIAALTQVRVESVELVRAGDRQRAMNMFVAEAAFARPRAIRDSAARLMNEERRLLTVREEQQRRSARMFFFIIGAAGLLLTALVALTALTLLRFTRDLAASRDRLRKFNEGLEAQVAMRTADLTRANEEIQRFAYIVSHDLRSPLVNVMGFTAELEAAGQSLGTLIDRIEAEAPQLLTAEASAAVREDLPEAVGFIRTSTAKMDRLINAILKLSREGRRVLTPEPINPVDIAEAAVGALRHIIDERGIAVDVRGPMPRIVSDRLAVEQILSNLIENATKYLQPGRPGRIIVSGEHERGRIALSVKDNGRGIAVADHQRIFDLFRRSGVQDQPGEGIGLAHVRALAYRLGGTIDLQSTPGEGSTFRLVLPPILQAEGQPA